MDAEPPHARSKLNALAQIALTRTTWRSITPYFFFSPPIPASTLLRPPMFLRQTTELFYNLAIVNSTVILFTREEAKLERILVTANHHPLILIPPISLPSSFFYVGTRVFEASENLCSFYRIRVTSFIPTTRASRYRSNFVKPKKRSTCE